MTSIFISYRRADSAAFTGRIYDRVVDAFGERHIFKDVEDIPAGEDFRSVLDRALTAADVVLVIMGPQWVMMTDDEGKRRLNDPNDFVRIEVETALKRSDVLVIPVLVNNATMPDPAALPAPLKDLSYRNSVVVRNDPDFNHDITLLIKAIQKRTGGRSAGRLPLILGGLAALVVVALAVIFLTSRGNEQSVQPTEAAQVATTVSTDSPTTAPTDVPTDAPTDAPTDVPTDSSEPTAETTEVVQTGADVTPTVLYPDGRLLRFLYNDTSFYLYNPNATLGVSPILFEGVDADGESVNITFSGARWTQLFESVFRNNCAAIEPDTLLRFLRPSTCNAFNARVTLAPTTSHFWRSSSGAAQFRVLWNNEEIGRCPVADGTTECEVRLPPA